MTESDIQSQIRIGLSDYGMVFRTNSGEFWQGDVVYSNEFKQKALINLRRVSGLPQGFTDVFFVGENKVAFIEVKMPRGKAKPEQERFIQRVRSMGHRAGIARSVDDAIKIIEGEV